MEAGWSGLVRAKLLGRALRLLHPASSEPPAEPWPPSLVCVVRRLRVSVGRLGQPFGLLSLLFLSFLFSRLSLLEGFLRVLPLLSLSLFILAFSLCFFLFLLLLGFVPLHTLVERVHVTSCFVQHVMWVEQFNRRRTEGACGQD